MRKDVLTLDKVLEILKIVKNEIHPDVTLRAVETFLLIAKHDKERMPLNSSSLGEKMSFDMPTQKSTVARNVSLFNGRSRNRHQKFDFIEQREDSLDYRIKNLVLNPKGETVVNRITQKIEEVFNS
ncbi:hypothetical protein [Aliikangiella sp. IMCC44632]